MPFSTTQPIVKIEDGRNYSLLKAFQYMTKDNDLIIVPIGFVTDFASVPRIFWNIIPPNGRYTCAAIVHDFLCVTKKYPQKRTDDIFLEAMEELGVSWWRRQLMHKMVRMYSKISGKG